MSIVSSNMISKHYCPKCYSFDLFKVHRTFIQKNILGSANKFQCKACEEIFKQKAFESNIPKEVPVFIDQIPARPMAQKPPQVTAEKAGVVVEKTVNSPLSPKSADKMVNGDFVSDDNLKVTEAAVHNDDEPQETKKPEVSKGPPLHDKGKRLVDEPILTKQKKGLWPYVVGSTMVLLGAAYAFIWMPLTSNASTNGFDKMDMSIGSPGQVWAEAKLKKPEVLAEVTELASPPVVDKTSFDVIAQIPKTVATKLNDETADLPVKIAEKADESVMIIQPTRAALVPASEKVVELTPIAPLEVKDFKLESNVGTKADNALGGLALAKSLEKTPANNLKTTISDVMQKKEIPESNTLVNVPLPETTVKQYAVTKPEVKVVSVPAPVPDAQVIKAAVEKPMTKKVENVSAEAKNRELLEKVAIKFLQQDLDRLLLK